MIRKDRKETKIAKKTISMHFLLCDLCLFAIFALIGGCGVQRVQVPDGSNKPWTIVEGGVVRGDESKKQLALIFTGGDFGEGTGHVLDTLAGNKIKGSFFVTGDYLRNPEHQEYLKRIVADGHYLGPHADKHAPSCPWEDRSKTLVTG